MLRQVLDQEGCAQEMELYIVETVRNRPACPRLAAYHRSGPGEDTRPCHYRGSRRANTLMSNPVRQAQKVTGIPPHTTHEPLEVLRSTVKTSQSTFPSTTPINQARNGMLPLAPIATGHLFGLAAINAASEDNDGKMPNAN